MLPNKAFDIMLNSISQQLPIVKLQKLAVCVSDRVMERADICSCSTPE